MFSSILRVAKIHPEEGIMERIDSMTSQTILRATIINYTFL